MLLSLCPQKPLRAVAHTLLEGGLMDPAFYHALGQVWQLLPAHVLVSLYSICQSFTLLVYNPFQPYSFVSIPNLLYCISALPFPPSSCIRFLAPPNPARASLSFPC